MTTSKLKSFEPIIKNNVQNSFIGKDKKTYWPHMVAFEDGATGEANSATKEPIWEIGIKYDYTSVPSIGNYPSKIKMTKHKEHFQKSTYNDPKEIKMMCRRVSQDNAVKTISSFNLNGISLKQVLYLCDLYYKWTIKPGIDSRSIAVGRAYTISRAIEYSSHEITDASDRNFDKVIKWVIELATDLETHLNGTLIEQINGTEH